MTVNCRWVEDRLIDAVDHRLSGADELRLLGHLDGCQGCSARAAGWGRLVESLRKNTPRAISQERLRRMEAAIIEQAARPSDGKASFPAPHRRRTWIGMAAVAACLVIAMLGVRAWRHSLPTEKTTTAAPSMEMAIGAPMVLDNAPRRLTVGPASIEVVGPTTLRREGDGSRVLLRLEGGSLTAVVRHLGDNESFAVATRRGTVSVRGTLFRVMCSGDGSARVEVSEGLVAIDRIDGTHEEVGAGSSASLDPLPPPPSPATNAPRAPAHNAVPIHAADVAEVRAAVRAHDDERAIQRAEKLLARAPGNDDLRYLRAEALRHAGRASEAIAAYRELASISRRPQTQENALHAAADLERRAHHPAAAYRLYRRALEVAPGGDLVEEAMAGLFETAHDSGDVAGERAAIDAYLARFPSGTFRVAALAARAKLDRP